jgi:hypothetical protein
MAGYPMALFHSLSLGVALVLGPIAMTRAAGPQGHSRQCRPDGPVAAIAELPEASGLAVSRRGTGRLWAHNDSGEPILFALDSRGSVTGRVRLSGVTLDDWEAVAVGSCPGGSCVYVADIGDNNARREHITIYRFPEPSGSEASVSVNGIFHAQYPDGAHDAEAVLVTSDNGIFIATKGDTGPVALYRFPRELRPGATHPLERVGTPRESGIPARNERVTDGAVSADGEWIVLRTRQNLRFYRAAELLAGNWRVVSQYDLQTLGETQGEGVALGANDAVFLTGEGGGKSRPGTFARLVCSVSS